MRSALTIGSTWGVLCAVANFLPIVSTLAQMAVPWIWVAAIAGYCVASSRRQAALVGGATLLAANVGYFVVGVLQRGMSDLPLAGGARFLVLWAVVGMVVGPIAAVIGWMLARGQGPSIAVVALAGISVAEPLALWAHIDHMDAHLAYIGVAAAGLVFPIVWFWGEWRRAVIAFALVLVAAYPAALVLEASLIVLDQISPPMRLV